MTAYNDSESNSTATTFTPENATTADNSTSFSEPDSTTANSSAPPSEGQAILNTTGSNGTGGQPSGLNQTLIPASDQSNATEAGQSQQEQEPLDHTPANLTTLNRTEETEAREDIEIDLENDEDHTE